MKSKLKTHTNIKRGGLVACALIGSLLWANCWGATYYLNASTGDDTATGTSPETAWKTLDRARVDYSGGETPVVDWGDTVMLYNGDYGAFELDRFDFDSYAGDTSDPLPAETDWVTYQRVTGQDEVKWQKIEIDCSYSPPYLVAHKFIGIRIRDYTPDNETEPVWIGGAVGIVLQDCNVCGTTDPEIMYDPELHTTCDTVYFSGSNYDVTIADCNITQGNKGLTISGNNIEITDCNIWNNGDDRLNLNTVNNCVVDHCLLHLPIKNKFVEANHPDLLQLGGTCSNVIVRRTKFYDHTSQGLWCSTTIDFDTDTMIWENNLIYSTWNYEWTFYNCHGLIFRHNTVIHNGATTPEGPQSNAGGIRFNLSRRIWYATPEPDALVNTTADSTTVTLTQTIDLSNVIAESDVIHIDGATGGAGPSGDIFTVMSVDDETEELVVSPAVGNTLSGVEWEITEGFAGLNNNNQMYNNLFLSFTTCPAIDSMFSYHDYNIGLALTGSDDVFIDDESNSPYNPTISSGEQVTYTDAMGAAYFTNYDANDYTLKSGALPINAGTSEKTYPSTDIDGNPRDDGHPDIGCYEYQAATNKKILILKGL